MMTIYSVKILLESTVVPNPHLSKTFEEVIVLVKAKNYEEIEAEIRQKYAEDTYKNAEGGQTTWRLIKILDLFETVDKLEGDLHLKEVYSRFLPFDQPITADEVIKLYSLDK